MVENKQLTIVVGIIENNGRFLIIRRVDDVPEWHHKWELPGGKIEPGEHPAEALHREIHEETGLSLENPELLGVHTHHWHLPDHVQQTFLIVYRVASDSDAVTLRDDENDAYQWVTLDEFFRLENHLAANHDMITALYAPRMINN